MKTAELIDTDLDYWVARAIGHNVSRGTSGFTVLDWQRPGSPVRGNPFQPSTSWAQAGPIIEQAKIDIGPRPLGGWHAAIYDWSAPAGERWKAQKVGGETPLVAAMRAFVASKFGEEVEDAKP